MKKISFLLPLIALAMVSCDNSPLAKADRLVRKEMPKNLVFPDSYDPIETKIDSAFYPMDDFKFYEYQETLNNLNKKYAVLRSEFESMEIDLDLSKSIMNLCSGLPLPFFEYGYNESKNKTLKYNEELKAKQEEINKVKGKALDIIYELKEILAKEPIFIGYRATHSYRAKNSAEQTTIERDCFFLNKEITEIKETCSKEEYETLIEEFKQLKEEIDAFPKREEKE